MTETQEQPQIEAPAVRPDPLKVVLNILRNRKAEHDFTVTFTVKDESSFRDVFTKFLNELPKTAKITVKTADDSETKKPVRMFMDIESYGAQQQIAGRLQQYAQILKPYCLEIK